MYAAAPDWSPPSPAPALRLPTPPPQAPVIDPALTGEEREKLPPKRRKPPSSDSDDGQDPEEPDPDSDKEGEPREREGSEGYSVPSSHPYHSNSADRSTLPPPYPYSSSSQLPYPYLPPPHTMPGTLHEKYSPPHESYRRLSPPPPIATLPHSGGSTPDIEHRSRSGSHGHRSYPYPPPHTYYPPPPVHRYEGHPHEPYPYPPPPHPHAYPPPPPPRDYPPPAHPGHSPHIPPSVPYPIPGHPAQAIVYTEDAATKLSDRVRRRCFNCCTTDTSTWRRSNLSPGKVLCNKCGLFERTHSRPRPDQFPHKRGPLATSALGRSERSPSDSMPPPGGHHLGSGQLPSPSTTGSPGLPHPLPPPGSLTMSSPASHHTQLPPPRGLPAPNGIDLPPITGAPYQSQYPPSHAPPADKEEKTILPGIGSWHSEHVNGTISPHLSRRSTLDGPSPHVSPKLEEAPPKRGEDVDGR
ncbi:hypothetical protein VNI00_008179 [Paramarasmius palmivorus]|uniref:GATA-type domain-containing protein n=1 Tax=Paramarasmius palmivorus TaxID=297713 RepID=A0AAW0CYS4_9AGAR